jgi:hypothetical protein
MKKHFAKYIVQLKRKKQLSSVRKYKNVFLDIATVKNVKSRARTEKPMSYYVRIRAVENDTCQILCKSYHITM